MWDGRGSPLRPSRPLRPLSPPYAAFVRLTFDQWGSKYRLDLTRAEPSLHFHKQMVTVLHQKRLKSVLHKNFSIKTLTFYTVHIRRGHHPSHIRPHRRGPPPRLRYKGHPAGAAPQFFWRRPPDPAAHVRQPQAQPGPLRSVSTRL